MGNLARLEREKPGAIEKIDAVVIPARITGKLVDSWNLVFDTARRHEDPDETWKPSDAYSVESRSVVCLVSRSARAQDPGPRDS